MEDRTKGAWIIHHTNKLERYSTPSGFDELYTAGKCGKLLSAITTSENENEKQIDKKALRVFAEDSKINSLEQDAIVNKLVKEKLIDVDSKGNIVTLGLTQTSLLKHTTKIFEGEEPSKIQTASLALSEYVSESPIQEMVLKERISDEFSLSSIEVNTLLERIENFKIVDSELLGDEKLLFNGNLFRRDSLLKTGKVMDSLSSLEQAKIVELNDKIEKVGCITIEEAKKIIGEGTFTKLAAIGFYDVSTVANDLESRYFVTKPVSFGKFGDGLLNDALDLAKALVSSFSYGMIYSHQVRGRIYDFEALMNKLLRGEPVGPAPAIGADYRALELKGVVSITLQPGSTTHYYMTLLKKDIGRLAKEVLTNGTAVESVVFNKLNSNVRDYSAPETNREVIREKITTKEDKLALAEKLSIIRTIKR